MTADRSRILLTTSRTFATTASCEHERRMEVLDGILDRTERVVVGDTSGLTG